MIKPYYCVRDIINPGECLVAGWLGQLIYDDLDWRVFHGLFLAHHSNHLTQRGEVDFLLVCELGIIVLEVKGGTIRLEENNIYQCENGDKERQINPFGQARGNADSVRSFVKSKTGLEPCVAEAVVFAESIFNYDGLSYKDYWHPKSPVDFLRFIRSVLDTRRNQLGLNRLSPGQINLIVSKLAPTVSFTDDPIRVMANKKQTEENNNRNFQILLGLRQNPRILIEGPPGSGKSGFARWWIVDQAKRSNTKILYLCWNELLASYMANYFSGQGLQEQVTALAYFRYVSKLYKKCYGEELEVVHSNNLHPIVTKLIPVLNSACSLETYDMIVVDEGQDLFKHGLDNILEYQLHGGGNGLKRGGYLVFYDSLQAFNAMEHSELQQFAFSIIRDSAVHYKLFDSFRAVAGGGIEKFLDSCMQGQVDLDVKARDFRVYTFKHLLACREQIAAAVQKADNVDKVPIQDIVVLLCSSLMKEAEGSSPTLGSLLASDEKFEKITPENLNLATEKIRYTTALKYKGLESPYVILVIDDLFNVKYRTFYQMYIGASRAMAKLVLIIDEKSAEECKKRVINIEAMQLDLKDESV